MPQIRCPSVMFFSPEDETAFFQWATRIPGIDRVFGEGLCIVLSLRSKRMSEITLRELIALLFRYNVPMDQLATYETARNTKWFRAPDVFWHERVFA